MTPRVGILVGSQNDMPVLEKCTQLLEDLGIEYEMEVRSAHRDPEGVSEYAGTARERGLGVLICAAGMASMATGLALLAGSAALAAGAVAALTGAVVALCGAGFGAFMTPNNRTMLSAAPKARAGGAGGMQATARVLGTTLGATTLALSFQVAGADGGPRLALGAGIGFALAAAGLSLSRRGAG